VWSRKAESAPGEVRTNERLRQLLVVECRVRVLSRVIMWWLSYVGIEVVRTLNVKTATLYVIRRWTGSQCSWQSIVTWCVIALAPEQRSERHCSAHVEASGCCWLEHHRAQRCSSQVLTGSDCRLTSVRASSSASVVYDIVSDGLCVIVARSYHWRHVVVEGQTSIKHDRLAVLSSCQLSADRRR